MGKGPLLASMGADPIFFLGPIVDVHMAASSTAALANLTGVYIGSDFNNGADWTSTIAVGEMKRPAGSFSEGTTYGNGSMWSCRGKIMVTTNASAPGANSFLGFIVRTARLIRTIHYDFTGDPTGTGQNTKSWTDRRLLRLFGPENTDLGWTTATGTANRGAFAAYGGATMGAAYVQAEAQATDDAAKNASQRVKALEEALRSAKIIN